MSQYHPPPSPPRYGHGAVPAPNGSSAPYYPPPPSGAPALISGQTAHHGHPDFYLTTQPQGTHAVAQAPGQSRQHFHPPYQPGVPPPPPVRPQGQQHNPPSYYSPPPILPRPAPYQGIPSSAYVPYPPPQASQVQQPQYAPSNLPFRVPPGQVPTPGRPLNGTSGSSPPQQQDCSHRPYPAPPTTSSTRPAVSRQGETTPSSADLPLSRPNGSALASASQNLMVGLTSGMNGLAVGSGADRSSPQVGRGFDDDSPRLPPPMRATGLPDEVLSYCPEWRAIDYSLYWYHLPEAPRFFICTRCHSDHIRHTPLAGRFQRIKRADREITSCWFYVPRVTEILWPQTLSSGNIDALRAFMERRVDVKACKGQGPVACSEGITWFTIVSNDINGFVSCEACYEDRIAGGSFERRFNKCQRQQGPDEKWSCDACIPFISRCIVMKAKQKDWANFVALASRRFQLPACEGREVQSNSCKWYRPRRKIEGFQVCETCYMDKLMLTRFEHHLEQVSRLNDLDSFIQQFTTRLKCKLTTSNLPMVFALENALERRDWSVFQNSATAISRLVPCTADGIVGGNWWTLKGGCSNFDVCEACYIGILQAGGTAQFFEQAQRNPKETLVCDFCVASPRFAQYLDRYAQALDTGVFAYYTDFVRTFASVAVCPGSKSREKTTWWGYPEGLFCQDCYLSFVSKTALGKSVPLKNAYDERHQICQIWSPRMRNLWLKACEAGESGSSGSNEALAEFKAFCEKRFKVYVQTVPQWEMMLAMKKMRVQQAAVQGIASTMYHGMDGLAQVNNNTDGYLHGNSQLGWHSTELGVQGAQMAQNMQAGFRNANRMDEWMQMAQLEMIWKEVE